MITPVGRLFEAHLTAKMLGVAAVLFPGASRIKEWAFAGLTFDLTGARAFAKHCS